MASVAVDREIRRRLTSAGSGLGDHPHAHHHRHHHHHHAAAAAMAAMALPANKIIISPSKTPGVVLAPAHGHRRRASAAGPPPPPAAEEAPSGHPSPTPHPPPAAHPPPHLAAKRRKHGPATAVRDDMFQHYQPWVIHTYGDSAKTKTITLRKYARIVRTLRGEETNSVENSKFRFWVKAKGFRLGQPPGYVAKPADGIVGSQTLSGAKDARDDPPLYVPTSAAKDGFGGGGGGGVNQFKKVAVVENFFDIIYSVHVEMEGRAGKHAGQKRTYRTITETYAFLPREAVTRFLLGCTDCQRRPRSRSASPSPCTSPAPTPTPAAAPMQPPPPAPAPAPAPSPPQHSPHHPASPLHPAHQPQQAPPPPPHQSPLHQPQLASPHAPPPQPPLHQPHLLHPLSQLHLQQFQHQHPLAQLHPPLPPPPLPPVPQAALPPQRPHTPPSPHLPPPPLQPHPDTPSPQAPHPFPIPLSSPRPIASPVAASPEPRRRSCSPAPASPPPPPPPPPPAQLQQRPPADDDAPPAPPAPPAPAPLAPAESDGENETRRSPPASSPPASPAPPRTPPRLSPSPAASAATPGSASPPPPPPGPTLRLFSSYAPPHVVEPIDIDFSLPITTTYLKHMRSLGYTDEDALRMDTDDNVSTPEADGSEDDHYSGASKEADKLRQMLLAWNGHAGRNGDMRLPDEREAAAGEEVAGLWAGYHGALGLKKSTPPGAGREQSSPLMLSDRSLTQETSSVHDETSSSGNKEDEDDDDDDAEDKIDPQQYDPERLKAFNMFVRLFVDENLDRIVPISKQPKEKIQAIIDSCTRQFPEFAERARKRIRTYLKSCRRNKRSRDSNGAWDATRPTPAHLTSVQAEQILAQACENESHNAKRMRLGLEPVSQPMPLLPNATVDGRPSPLEHYTSAPSDTKLSLTSAALKTEPISHASEAAGALSPASFGAPGGGGGGGGGSGGGAATVKSEAGRASAGGAAAAAAAAASAVAAVTSASMASVNGSATSAAAAPTSVYRPNFSQAFQRAATAAAAATAGPYAAPAMFGGAPFASSGGMLSNGPTDLSMKTKPLLSHKLNTAEMAAVRQLITGYRESAAFLLRSADELEQLLLQQQ